MAPLGQAPGDAAAGAAVADGQQLLSRVDAQPDRVQFAPAHEVDQSLLLALPDMFFRLLPGHPPSPVGVDAQGRPSQEEAAQFRWVVPAGHGFAADAEVHDPEII